MSPPSRPRTVYWLVAAVLAALSAGGLFSSGWFEGPTRVPPELQCPGCNLIIISLSNLQRHRIGLYGYARPTTPNIDRFFAAQTVKIENGIAPASLTYTDSLSLFYSLYPYTHKLMARGQREESAAVLSGRRNLSEILRANGYYTVAFVSDEDYAYDYGLGRTFNSYFDRSHYPEYGILFKPWQYNIGTKDLVAPAVDWLKHNHRSKFLLFLQLYDMHCPYTPSPRFAQRFDPDYRGPVDDADCYMTLAPAKEETRGGESVWLLDSWFSMMRRKQRMTPFSRRDLDHLHAMYDAELAEADSRLAEMFVAIRELGLLKNSVVIFMSEHGDYLGENGYYMKAALSADGNLHNANLGFAFLMRLPHLGESLSYRPPVSLVDIVPTLLEVLGVRSPSRTGMQGLSVAGDLPHGLGVHDYVFSGSIRERSGEVHRVEALQNLEWKLTAETDPSNPGVAPVFKLVHLAQDPGESLNVAERYPERVASMFQRIIAERDAKERMELGERLRKRLGLIDR